MTYTPAQISTAKGGDVFPLDYAHADVVQTFSFGSGGWGLYKANNISVGSTLLPAYGSDGNSLAGSWRGSVTLFHLSSYSSARIEYDASGVTVEYSLDNTNWTLLAGNTTIPLRPTSQPDLDIRVTFAGGQANDPAVVNSITVYVLSVGQISSASGSRVLTIGTDPINSDGLLTSTETISASVDAINIGAIELRAAISALGTTIFSGTGISLSTGSDGTPQATGCTAYVNGNPLASAPKLVAGAVPYHFVVVPTTPVNEVFTLGAGLTVSNLALYQRTLSGSDAYTLYASDAVGMPTITITDTATITVTESTPAVDIYAYAWSIVSGTVG